MGFRKVRFLDSDRRMPPAGAMTRQDDSLAVPGAYALVIRLETVFAAAIGALGDVVLPPGSYVYLGSANGPGGMAARVRRHLKREKRLHWHVDHLTNLGALTDIALWPGGDECALVEHLSAGKGITFPVPGFGSSDCRHCAAHLLAAPVPKRIMNRLNSLPGMRLYSAASFAPSAATDPAIV